MKITSIQKVIKVGSSLAVTIPAKEAKFYGIKAGDDLEVNVKQLEPTRQDATSPSLDAEYKAFKEEYGETLKNLSDR